MNKYWIVKVESRFEQDNGKLQKILETYCVHALSPTDVEAKINEYFVGNSNFRIKSVTESKILEIIK